MPRYAVLSHDWPTPHFDLLLEDEGICRTWRLPTWPPHDGMPIERIADHRTIYLDYDGPVRGDRGHVTTVERGQFEWQSRSETEVTFTPARLWPWPAPDAAHNRSQSRERDAAPRLMAIRDGRLFLPGQRQPGQ